MSRYSSPLLNKEIPNIKEFTTILNRNDFDPQDLYGKVVLLQFWTFGCYNCVNTLPYMREWYDELSQHGIEIISVHTPEFDYEKIEENVEKAIEKHKITYPVFIDNDYKIWNSFKNRWWPHFFLIDKQGVVQYNFVGEGQYAKIRELLLELNDENV